MYYADLIGKALIAAHGPEYKQLHSFCDNCCMSHQTFVNVTEVTPLDLKAEQKLLDEQALSCRPTQLRSCKANATRKHYSNAFEPATSADRTITVAMQRCFMAPEDPRSRWDSRLRWRAEPWPLQHQRLLLLLQHKFSHPFSTEGRQLGEA